ncbi:MAG TPA: NnrS family protein [Xanthobacteraceae bacterium]|jgi:uncharacterized protein involved in response to NO|nr:NnrS family protein [Xanthobacteraceae bacterium]
MAAIPRYRPHAGPILLSAGFRPFFLGSAVWAAIGIPLWLAVYGGGTSLPSLLPPLVWHVHEMVFGFAAATVAGFLLTAIPNWTGRMPLQGRPLAVLVLLWAVGRAGILLSGSIGGYAAAVADLAFPAAFLGAVAREIVAGKNWRNLPLLVALSLLLIGNLFVHLDAIGVADTAKLGNRIGVATLLMLISLVGGRIIPSFTRNWLTKNRPEVSPPRPEGWIDHAVLGVTALALVSWAVAPDAVVTAWGTIIAGSAISLRMSRWQGHKTIREPLLIILHVGYGWLAAGLLLLGLNEFFDLVPMTAALHALTVGAIGTMTLAVMTRASLGHTGRPLIAGLGTQVIYALVTLAALLRVLSPFAGAQMVLILWAAGASWAAAFGLFAILYGRVLTQPRATGHAAKPI